MKLSALLLAIKFIWLLAMPVYAQEPVDMTGDLEGFIKDAIEAGVLVDPDATKAEAPYEVIGKDANGCSVSYPLDFSNYHGVRSYSDIAKYREGTPEEASALNTKLIKAYLALGLYAEVMAALKESDQLANNAYIQIAKLMDGYRQSDRNVFVKLADCYSEGELWRAIYLLGSGDIAGADILDRHLETYRDLPFQLRADVTALILPTLRYNKQHFLGQKLAASFNQEEIKQSKRLYVQVSFLKNSSHNGSNPEFAYDFISKVAPEMQGLFLGAEDEILDGPTQRAIVLEEAYSVLERSTDKALLADALQFVLNDVGQGRGYDSLATLLTLVTLNTPNFKAEIQAHLSEQLLSDLTAEEYTTRFAAVNFLMNNPQIFAGHRDLEEMLRLAESFLKETGHTVMATMLIQETDTEIEDPLLSARLAYRQGDGEKLYQIVKSNEGRADIIRVAALFAVRKKDEALFSKVEEKLPEDGSFLLELANEDAVNAGWLLSDKTYEIIRRLSDDESLARLEQIFLLKELNASERNLAAASRSSSLGTRLAASNLILDRYAVEGDS